LGWWFFLQKKKHFNPKRTHFQWFIFFLNDTGVILGIGVVTSIYDNPDQDRFWAIDYRMYAPDEEGKSKIDHVYEILQGAIYSKKQPFQTD
jgi:hypothetical protein